MERLSLSSEHWPRRIGAVAVWLFFSVYLLWVGWSGYGSITLSRHQCFLALLALWALLALPFWFRAKKWNGPKIILCLLLGLWLWFLASSLASPYPDTVWLGAKRREGFVTLTAYLLLFYLGSQFGSLERYHLWVLAIAMLLLDTLVVLQFAGRNPLSLYPEGLTFHHRYIAYGGEYLGTVGNSDMLAAVFSVTIPLLLLWPHGGKTSVLTTLSGAFSFLALLLSEVQSGPVALLACFLLLLPVCLWKRQHPPLLRAAGLLMGVWGIYSLLDYDFTGEILTFSLSLSPHFFLGLLACIGLFTLSKWINGGRKQAVTLLAIYGGTVLSALLFLLLYRGSNASIVLLQQTLSGNIPDSLGSSRIQIWKEGLQLLAQHPVLGTGPDTYGIRSQILFTRVTESGAVRRSTVDAAHNEYLHLAVCCGIPALVCHVGLQWGVILQGLKRLSPALLPLTAAAICWSVQSFFGISQSVSTPLCWLMLGLLYHAIFERREPNAQIG